MDKSRNFNSFKQDDDDLNYFLESLIVYYEENITSMFKKKRDIDIAYAILELLKKREEIENFNKKSLYILIREMTNVNTSHITSVVNVFKARYKKLINQFSNKKINITV